MNMALTKEDLEKNLAEIEALGITLHDFATSLGFGEDEAIYLRLLIPKGFDPKKPEHRAAFPKLCYEKAGRHLASSKKLVLRGKELFLVKANGEEKSVSTNPVAYLRSQNQMGFAPYIVVNPGGANKSSIAEARVIFWEADHKPKEEQLVQFQQHSAKWGGGMAVETKNSIHGYIRLDEPIPADQIQETQQRLILLMESDPSIQDPNRLMRLPGFDHLKVADDEAGKPALERFPVKLIHPWDGTFASRDAILAELPQLPEEVKKEARAQQERRIGSAKCEEESPKEVKDSDVLEALACIPQRTSGTYTKFRDITWALKAHFGENEAVRLMEAHSPSGLCGWNIEQVAQSGGDHISIYTLFYYAKQHGYTFPGKRKKPTQKEQKAQKAKMEAELLGKPADPSDLKYRVRASYRELGEMGEGIRLQKSAKEVDIAPDHSAIAEYLRGKYGPKLGKIGNDLYRFNADSGLMEPIEAGDIYELIKNEMDSAWGYEFDYEAKPPSCLCYEFSFKEKLSDSWLKGATNATLNALPKIEITPQNPNLIPLLDGILDLETGTLTPYEVAAANGQFWSYKAQFPHSESFECDRWMDFLAETVHPDDIEPLQAVMCATLMGLTRLKFSVELCGARDSGKSVLQRIMQAFFGGKNSPVIASLDFQKLLKSDEKFSMGAIVGKRLLIIPDTRGLVGSSDRYKQITSGGDLIQAEFKNEKHSQNFTPEGILWSAGNSFLRFSDDDDATRSRRIQIRFPHSIPRKGQRQLLDFVGDSMLGELVEELPSILNWALAAKEQVNELIGTYKERAANNPVLAFERDPSGQWMLDCLAVGEGFRTNMGIATQNHTLYGNYKEWCAEHGISKPLSTIHLKDKLAELLNRYQKIVNVQYVEDKQARKWYWEGVGVLTVNGTPNKDYLNHGYSLIGERLVPEVLEVALDNGTWHEATVIKRDADENIQIRLDTGHYARNPWTGTVKASQTRAAA